MTHDFRDKGDFVVSVSVKHRDFQGVVRSVTVEIPGHHVNDQPQWLNPELVAAVRVAEHQVFGRFGIDLPNVVSGEDIAKERIGKLPEHERFPNLA